MDWIPSHQAAQASYARPEPVKDSPAVTRLRIENFRTKVGQRPIAASAAHGYLAGMNPLLLILILLLLFGGGGFYIGGPVIGGSGLGLILLICLIIYLLGGLRTKN